MVSRVLPPGAVYHPAGITAFDVTVRGYNGDPVSAYVARPTEGGPHPGLLLVHGIHGYEEHMKDMARRYAALGYAAIVPALYSRDGFLTVIEESDLDLAREALAARPNAQTVGDLQGGLDFLRASPHVTERIGLVGFCSGGRLGLVFASSPDSRTAGLDVFVNFYSNGLFSPQRSTRPLRETWLLALPAQCSLCSATRTRTRRPTTLGVCALCWSRRARLSSLSATRAPVTPSCPIPEKATGQRRPRWPGAAAWNGCPDT